MPPVKNPCDFLRRHYPHQVIGSKFGYFLSACHTSSPVFISVMIVHLFLWEYKLYFRDVDF